MVLFSARRLSSKNLLALCVVTSAGLIATFHNRLACAERELDYVRVVTVFPCIHVFLSLGGTSPACCFNCLGIIWVYDGTNWRWRKAPYLNGIGGGGFFHLA